MRWLFFCSGVDSFLLFSTVFYCVWYCHVTGGQNMKRGWLRSELIRRGSVLSQRVLAGMSQAASSHVCSADSGSDSVRSLPKHVHLDQNRLQHWGRNTFRFTQVPTSTPVYTAASVLLLAVLWLCICTSVRFECRTCGGVCVHWVASLNSGWCLSAAAC